MQEDESGEKEVSGRIRKIRKDRRARWMGTTERSLDSTLKAQTMDTAPAKIE